jgi:hypothetical protein
LVTNAYREGYRAVTGGCAFTGISRLFGGITILHDFAFFSALLRDLCGLCVEVFRFVNYPAAEMSHQPNNIFAGTQVVSLVEVRGTNNSLVHPRGAVGVVTRTPVGHP